MPGEDAVNAGAEMEAMPDDAAEGSIVNRLPGEELSSLDNDAMADFSSREMPATESFGDAGMPATDMDAANTIFAEAMSGVAMPGEEGMGMAMADFMPGEQLSVQEPGTTGAEISGTFRLTLIPA
jgi:hypothetical protein